MGASCCRGKGDASSDTDEATEVQFKSTSVVPEPSAQRFSRHCSKQSHQGQTVESTAADKGTLTIKSAETDRLFTPSVTPGSTVGVPVNADRNDRMDTSRNPLDTAQEACGSDHSGDLQPRRIGEKSVLRDLDGDGGPVELALSAADQEYYSILSTEAQAAVNALESETSWGKVKPLKGLEDCTIEVLGGKRVVARVSCNIPACVEDIVRTIDGLEQSPRGTITTRLQQVSSKISLLWTKLKLPIVSDRDFVFCQRVDYRPGTTQTSYVTCVSLPAEKALKVKPETKKVVRGTIVFQSTAMTPLPDDPSKTRVMWVSCVELAGMIPSVKNLTARRGAESLLTLQKAVLAANGRKARYTG